MLQMKIKNKEHAEKGITLIALIVTIIVLLILAGVTITNITNGDGIIEQASGQRDKTKISAEEQILGNAVISASDKFGEITENNLRQSLSNQNVEITKSGGLYKITFKDTNNLYKMNKDGEYFYWENMQPTDIYAKLYTDKTLILSSYDYTDETRTLDIDYGKDQDWRSDKFDKVIIHDAIAPNDCKFMFSNCSKLESIEQIENLHTENATSMMDMFYKCSSLKSLDLKYFDTSKVTMMYRMFGLCSKIESINVISFDTTNVGAMPEMFNGCYRLKNLDVSNFDTSKQTNMYVMFGVCWKLKSLDLSNFDLSRVTNLDIAISTMKELTSIKTPKKHPTNQSLSIDLPKTFYDQDGNSYNAITSTTPTQIWLYAK